MTFMCKYKKIPHLQKTVSRIFSPYDCSLGPFTSSGKPGHDIAMWIILEYFIVKFPQFPLLFFERPTLLCLWFTYPDIFSPTQTIPFIMPLQANPA